MAMTKRTYIGIYVAIGMATLAYLLFFDGFVPLTLILFKNALSYPMAL